MFQVCMEPASSDVGLLCLKIHTHVLQTKKEQDARREARQQKAEWEKTARQIERQCVMGKERHMQAAEC